jgi:peptide/nickel transport system substrate-binding protein
MGPIMKQFLEMVGFRVKLEMADFPTVLERVRQGNYDLTIIGWGFHGDPNETSRVYESKNPPPGGWNIMRYQNARVDRLYEQGRSTLDQKRRARIYQELQGILNDEVPTLFLIREDKLFGLSNRVKGAQFRAFRREAVPDDLWNIETWTLGGGN